MSQKQTKNSQKTPKFIFTVGGVISGVGKGITSSSIGKILQARGFTVTALKIDPYVNVDAGTMNPTEHGEVFVLDDGDECDQDMGNYERFLNTTLSRTNYMTTGRVFQSVINKERNLEYKGKCVQVVPHIPHEVIRRIKKATKDADADVAVIEIGGTVGEYESILYLEAARMMKMDTPDDVAFVMVSYLPTPEKVGEMKTKPTQHATRLLNQAGIQPDVIVARSERGIDRKRKEKIATFCNIDQKRVISAPDADSVYDIPLNFEKDKLSDTLLERLKMKPKRNGSDMRKWKAFVKKTKNGGGTVNIAIAGKYFDTGDFVLSDAYISVIEAVKYSAYAVGKKANITWLHAADYEQKRNTKKLAEFDGIIVPGGFGERGIQGKINVIQYARENNIPYFGLCYGMQLMVVEYARNVLGWKNANTVEIQPDTKRPIIDVMPDQKQKIADKEYGGSMRLGTYPCNLTANTVAHSAYSNPKSYKLEAGSHKLIQERHRHRYEVNPEYINALTEAGLQFSGTSPNKQLMEIAELPQSEHPFFLGTQFHPEFKARPLSPHPLFTAFLKAASGRKR